MRHIKIIATMGPAIASEKNLEKIIKAGANVIRINFSHGNHAIHSANIKMIREVAKRVNANIAILADLQGPEIRSDLNTHTLKKNQVVYFELGKGDVQNNIIGISHPNLHTLVKKGTEILADDGYYSFKVVGVEDKKIVCKVINGGVLKPKKSINVPNIDIDLPILNAKDKKDLDFIAKQEIDWLAASFVSSGNDVDAIRTYMKKIPLDIPIISKIESATSIDTLNLKTIIDKSEGIMVARGDLGVELPPEKVPNLQRKIVKLTKEKGKVIIIATQMLESMMEGPRPTRPETTDVSNAALEKVDALMLSGETAAGKYPVDAVIMMNKIICATQEEEEHTEMLNIERKDKIHDICKSALYLGQACHSKAVITVSIHGKSSRVLSSFRANTPVIVACTNTKLLRRSALYYSVSAILVQAVENAMSVFKKIEKILLAKKIVKKNDHVIFLFPYPSVTKHGTNTIREWKIT